MLDLTGKQFGRLTVICRGEDYVSPSGARTVRWLCKCSCGNPKLLLIQRGALTSGATVSCGCYQKEIAALTGRNNAKSNIIDDTSEEYAIGYTLKGEPFWFDKDDIPIVSKYCWSYTDDGYLYANSKEGKNILLHRLVMGFPDGIVDHKNHPPRNEHKVDNRKSNLRVVQFVENNMNRSLDKNNTTGITGISYNKNAQKYEAYIQLEHKIHLGLFQNIDDAIQARREAELEYFGEYRYGMYNQLNEKKHMKLKEDIL